MQYFSDHQDYTIEELCVDHRIEFTQKDLKLKKDVSCIFISDEAMLALNKSSLQHDYYTDILTFDYSDDDDYETSEIYISLDRVQENAKHFESSFVEELHRVIIHGLLHLAGYNDKLEADQVKMRSMENHYLDLQRST